jgi:acylpyruvate hydrolase
LFYQIPSEWDELHHEVELGVIIDKQCRNVSKEQAEQHIGGYCLALDMTARKVQDQLKKQGHPWLLAKGFDTSCPCGDFIDKKELDLSSSSVNLWLSVNGKMRQNGDTRDMIFSIPDLIAYISKYITLEHGDLILTGTPAGVGPVKSGDQIEAGINGENNFKYSMKFKVATQ